MSAAQPGSLAQLVYEVGLLGLLLSMRTCLRLLDHLLVLCQSLVQPPHFILARFCRNLNSGDCRLRCAMPNGMMTDAQVSVGDAEKRSRPQNCKVCVSTVMMPAVMIKTAILAIPHVDLQSIANCHWSYNCLWTTVQPGKC